MRTNVQAARDAGVGIGFFSSNTCYWQIRFGPSAITGAADRTIICYKSSTTDPVASNPNTAYLTTTQWRLPPVNLPEEALIGTQFGTDQVQSDIIVTNPSHWVYTYTGLANGAHLPGILGYEIDSMQGHQPSGTVGLAHETVNNAPADTTIYTATPGNFVFATGSFQWSWGLDDYNVPTVRPSVISPAAQQITRNVLARLAGAAISPAFSITPTPRAQALHLAPTGSVNFSVAVAAFGYSPSLTFSLSGLPAGASYTFVPSQLSGSGSSTLTVSANSSTPDGSYPLTIKATDGSQTRTEAVTLTLDHVVPKTDWRLVYVDSHELQCEPGAAVNSFDANSATIWHTQWCPTVAVLPHEIQIDLGAACSINGFRYLPRQDGGTNGRIGQYEFYATNNLSNWGPALATGTFANDATEKQVLFTANTYRYIRLRALTEANGYQFTSMAELSVMSVSSPTPTPTPTPDETPTPTPTPSPTPTPEATPTPTPTPDETPTPGPTPTQTPIPTPEGTPTPTPTPDETPTPSPTPTQTPIPTPEETPTPTPTPTPSPTPTPTPSPTPTPTPVPTSTPSPTPIQVVSATVNDSVTGAGNSQFQYVASKWTYSPSQPSAYQGDEHYATVTDTKARFKFNGTQVKIYTVKEPVGGNIGYSLDGTAEQVISNYSPVTIGNQLSYTSPIVAAGSHTVVIRVVGSHEPSSTSNQITVDKAEVYH
jgi:hypothetical protein